MTKEELNTYIKDFIKDNLLLEVETNHYDNDLFLNLKFKDDNYYFTSIYVPFKKE